MSRSCLGTLRAHAVVASVGCLDEQLRLFNSPVSGIMGVAVRARLVHANEIPRELVFRKGIEKQLTVDEALSELLDDRALIFRYVQPLRFDQRLGGVKHRPV